NHASAAARLAGTSFLIGAAIGAGSAFVPAVTAATAAAGPFFAGTGFAGVHLASRKLRAVHTFEGRSGFVIAAHFHEPETPGFSGQLVFDDPGRADVSEGRECVPEFFLGGLVRYVADIDIHLAFLLLNASETRRNP